MPNGILLPQNKGATPGSTLPPTFAGIVRNTLPGQSVMTMPPAASAGPGRQFISPPDFTSLVAPDAGAVGAPGRPGRLPAGIARAREAGGKALALGLSKVRSAIGR